MIVYVISFQTGRFLGDVDPVLMHYLYNHSVYFQEEEYDFQASCPVQQTSVSAGIKSIYIVSDPHKSVATFYKMYLNML